MAKIHTKRLKSTSIGIRVSLILPFLLSYSVNAISNQACDTSSSCPGSQTCHSSNLVIGSVCVPQQNRKHLMPCKHSSQCIDNLICDSHFGSCLYPAGTRTAGDYCDSSNDCTSNLMCRLSLCTQPTNRGNGSPCNYTSDCKPGLLCNRWPGQVSLNQGGVCSPPTTSLRQRL